MESANFFEEKNNNNEEMNRENDYKPEDYILEQHVHRNS